MPRSIPLIRAANLLPLVRFLEANGQDSGPFLKAAELDYWFALAPLDPIPLRNGIGLLRDIARDFGPDVGARIVSQSSIAELAFIGQVALGARTPLEALRRIAMALPLHSSHEIIRVEAQEGGAVTVLHRLTFPSDPESLHAVHGLLSAMIAQLCRFTGLQPPLLARIEAQPHPQAGLSELARHFGDRVTPGREGELRLTLDARVAGSPFRVVARDRLAGAGNMRIPPLAEDASLAGSVRPVVAAMLHGGEPTVQSVAGSAGMSVRTMQRLLAAEGTSFSAELDRVRRRLAVALLDRESSSIEEVSVRLGYAGASTFTRAVRRLTGRTPSQVQRRAGA